MLDVNENKAISDVNENKEILDVNKNEKILDVNKNEKILDVNEIKKIKAVVFDCDGVLFDTALANRMYYDTLLDHFGKQRLDDEQFRHVHMFTVKEALHYLFPEMSSIDMVNVYAFMKTMGYHRFIQYMQAEPGLKELLDDLKKAGYTRCIATNRTNTMADVLKQYDMEPLFEMVVTAADVENPKPAPDELLKIIAALNLKPEQILFVGDSEYDQLAAKAAGTWFAAFKNPSLIAHYHAVSMADLGNMLGLRTK
ncbi:MAG: HAD family hydrolase [Desulfamplus sp.]|nr:HAD family hydrolase [Desulfamplus sp.]